MAIRITEEEMLHRSTEVKNQFVAMDSLIKTMDRIVAALPNEWEGKASTAFCSRYQDQKKGLEATKQLLDEMYKKLEAVAKDFGAVDRGHAK